MRSRSLWRVWSSYRAEALLALDEKARRELSERTAPLEVGPLARDVTFIYSFRGQLQGQMKKPHRRYQRQTFRACTWKRHGALASQFGFSSGQREK